MQQKERYICTVLKRSFTVEYKLYLQGSDARQDGLVGGQRRVERPTLTALRLKIVGRFPVRMHREDADHAHRPCSRAKTLRETGRNHRANMHAQALSCLLGQGNLKLVARSLRLRQSSLQDGELTGYLIHVITGDTERARSVLPRRSRPPGNNIERGYLYRKMRRAAGIRGEIITDHLGDCLLRLLNLRRCRMVARQCKRCALLIRRRAAQNVAQASSHRYLRKERYRANQHHHREHT